MSAAAELGRTPITILEMDLKQTIGGSDQIITYRFSSADTIAPVSLDVRPILLQVQKMPARLAIGDSLGLRDSITVRLGDFINDNDVAGGPANPNVTFWQLLKARIPIVTNRPARLISAYITGGVLEITSTLHLFIQKIDGPSKDNTVSVQLSDALVKADNRKAQAPAVGTGTLLTGISSTDTTAIINPTDAADDYAASGFLRIGESKEIIAFTRTLDALTLIRGQLGSTAEAHSAGDQIQEIVVFQNETLSNTIYRLLTQYANVNPGLINKPAWDDENSVWLSTFNVSAIIWDPIGVTTLLQELTNQFPIFLLYDARVPEISFQALKPASFSLFKQINEREHLLRDSIDIKEDPNKRVSQIWFYFGIKDPSEKADDPRNFSRLVPFADKNAEDLHDEKRIRKVFSRWLPAGSSAVVTDIGDRLIRKLKNNKRTIGFDVDAKDSAIWVGKTIEITTERIVDHDGNPLPTFAQIIEAKENIAGTVYRYIAEDLLLIGRFGLYAPDSVPDFDAATDIQKERYVFYADENDQVNNGTEPGYAYF